MNFEQFPPSMREAIEIQKSQEMNPALQKLLDGCQKEWDEINKINQDENEPAQKDS